MLWPSDESTEILEKNLYQSKNEFGKSGSFFCFRPYSTQAEIQFLSGKIGFSYAVGRGENMVKLSHRILRRKMLEKDWKQEPLAEALGISDRHVRNLCYKDTDVSISLCYKLSRIFDTTMEELLEVKETQEHAASPDSSERVNDMAERRRINVDAK